MLSYDSQAVAAEVRDIHRIDAVDREILRLLSEDARISFRALGAAVGLSANGAADRVRRLRRSGVIEGFTVVLGVAARGASLEALVDVRLAPDQADDAFEAAVARLPSVVQDVHLAGRTDHQLRVRCRDADELGRLVRTLRRECGVVEIETRLILREALDRARHAPTY